MAEKKVAIMQPTYLPWLGYFDLMKQIDVFVIYDSVQFEKQSWQQRNRIRNKNGELMLTVPVRYESGLERKINEVKIDYGRNQLSKHYASISQSYSKAVNYKYCIEKIKEIYSANPVLLIDLNMAFIQFGMKEFNITTPLVYSSSLSPEGTKVDALIDICKKLDATHYISPPGAKGYIDENNLFPQNGIGLSYHEYQHPVYQQVNYPDFISHLSFIDYLFNKSS